MAKLRKTLGKVDDPGIVRLMRLIETQSKQTIVNWSVEYAQNTLLQIYEKAYPGDLRPQQALLAARAWMAGEIKLPVAKPCILACHAAAREGADTPAAQAAARAIGQAASSIHMPTHSLGAAFYAAAAIAYDRLGLQAEAQDYDAIAAQVFDDMERSLREIAVEGEPKPAKIKWNC